MFNLEEYMWLQLKSQEKKIFFLFWLRSAAWGILVPWPGIEPGPGSESAKY